MVIWWKISYNSRLVNICDAEVLFYLLFYALLVLNFYDTVDSFHAAAILELKALATIPYFNFHFLPHLLIFLQFRDPSYVLNLSTKAVLQKWHI